MKGMVFVNYWLLKMVHLKNPLIRNNYNDSKPENLLPAKTNPNARYGLH
jgi:hypothetical protein